MREGTPEGGRRNEAAGTTMPTGDVESIRRGVERIAAIARGGVDAPSPEAWAHEAEDTLRRDVLRMIAAGAPDAARLAAEALKTEDIRFSRWYE